MASGKQIEFPPDSARELADAGLLARIAALIVIVVVVLLRPCDGQFIGPW